MDTITNNLNISVISCLISFLKFSIKPNINDKMYLNLPP